jgi:hypothetical protein
MKAITALIIVDVTATWAVRWMGAPLPQLEIAMWYWHRSDLRTISTSRLFADTVRETAAA